MKDREIDEILKRAADAHQDVDPDLLDRISRSVGSALLPVKALPPSWVLEGGLIAICGVVALAAAMVLGPRGVKKMSAGEIGLIFSVLGILIWLAARLCVAEAVPGSRRPIAPGILGAAGCAGLVAVFGLLFHDYRTERFVAQGVACLVAGLATAIPVSVAAWLVLRRGFFVNSMTAGFANGVLAGLAGITMLELHCVNFEAPHLMLWHIAVMPISGLVGMLVAWKTTQSVR